MTDKTEEITRIATELTVATQTAALRLLEAEMQALAQMMPGAPNAAQPLPTEDEVEQGFENMPV